MYILLLQLKNYGLSYFDKVLMVGNIFIFKFFVAMFDIFCEKIKTVFATFFVWVEICWQLENYSDILCVYKKETNIIYSHIIRGQQSNFYIKKVFDTCIYILLPVNLLCREIFFFSKKIFFTGKNSFCSWNKRGQKFHFPNVMMIVGKKTFLPTFFFVGRTVFFLLRLLLARPVQSMQHQQHWQRKKWHVK